MQIGADDVLGGEQQEEEEGEVGGGVADKLDEGFLDEEAQRALWRQQVHQGEDGEEEPDDEAGDQFDHPVAAAPAREAVVPQGGQQLLAVGLSHEL